MELFVSDEMKEKHYGVFDLLKERPTVLHGILKTTSAMLGGIPSQATEEDKYYASDTLHDNVMRIFGKRTAYLFPAYPIVESLITNEHKGSTLVGQHVKVTQAVMQVYKEVNNLRWYISDRPLEDNTLRRITIDNKGSGYFTYFGPDAPNGSDYYIDQFKEW